MMCLYSTKSEPISKIAVLARARGSLKLNRTLEKACLPPRNTSATPKRKMFLAFWIFVGEFFLKWKGHFSFRPLNVFKQNPDKSY